MAEQIKTEQWKVIKNFPNYAVSDFGRIKRISKNCRQGTIGHILKPSITKTGYFHIILYQYGKPHKDKRVHRLVLEQFIGPCPANNQAHHLDGNKVNNYLSNLKWVTSSQNIKHAFEAGLLCPKKGEHHNFAKLFETDVLKIRKMYATNNYNQYQLAKQFNVDQGLISKIIRHRIWKHI